MRILIFHGYLLRGTGSNIYNASLVRAFARLGHEVELLCQDRDWEAPEGVTVRNPDIGRVLPVYVADRYEGFDAKPYPQLSDSELEHYLSANVAAVQDAQTPDVALANHLVMGPAILARGLAGRAPYAVKVHGSAIPVSTVAGVYGLVSAGPFGWFASFMPRTACRHRPRTRADSTDRPGSAFRTSMAGRSR